MGIAVLGIMFASFFGGLSQSLSIVQASREHLRATQIMTEKMDTIRLYTWQQITTPGYIPQTFQVPFNPTANLTNLSTGAAGITFNGAVRIQQSSLTESYKDAIREIKITLTWQSGKVTRQAEMSTFVSQYGMQSYIY